VRTGTRGAQTKIAVDRNQLDPHGRRGVGLTEEDNRDGRGYPVTPASLPRSGPGVGAPGGAPHAMNDLEPLPLVCYALGAGVTGYPRPW
jgi:hypothetical protein